MGIFIDQKDLEVALLEMKETGAKAISINRQLTEKSIDWLQNNGYYIKVYGFMSVIAGSPEDFPSPQEIKVTKALMLKKMYGSAGQ